MQGAALMLVPRGSRYRQWLVVRRPDPPYEWSVPGGHIESGESAVRAAIRELREETGVVALRAVPLGMLYDGTRPVHVFIAPQWSGAATAAEGLPVAWMSWADLRGQAARYGGSLDTMARTLRSRGVRL